jgi:hypothetical protein
MSTDAIAIFGWAYTENDTDEAINEKLEALLDQHPAGLIDGIEIGYHCCITESYYYVAAKQVTCWRGSVQDLSPLLDADRVEMTEAMRAFCDKHNIPFKEPQYLLLVWAEL